MNYLRHITSEQSPRNRFIYLTLLSHMQTCNFLIVFFLQFLLQYLLYFFWFLNLIFSFEFSTLNFSKCFVRFSLSFFNAFYIDLTCCPIDLTWLDLTCCPSKYLFNDFLTVEGNQQLEVVPDYNHHLCTLWRWIRRLRMHWQANPSRAHAPSSLVPTAITFPRLPLASSIQEFLYAWSNLPCSLKGQAARRSTVSIAWKVASVEVWCRFFVRADMLLHLVLGSFGTKT